MPISHHFDTLVGVTRGYGDAKKPGDFLDSFRAYVRDNINTIAALKLVVQRPRDLTRADLRALRTALDQKGYSEANLRRAWADAKNVDARECGLGGQAGMNPVNLATARRTFCIAGGRSPTLKRNASFVLSDRMIDRSHRDDCQILESGQRAQAR